MLLCVPARCGICLVVLEAPSVPCHRHIQVLEGTHQYTQLVINHKILYNHYFFTQIPCPGGQTVHKTNTITIFLHKFQRYNNRGCVIVVNSSLITGLKSCVLHHHLYFTERVTLIYTPLSNFDWGRIIIA